jgi:hypothetical protein
MHGTSLVPTLLLSSCNVAILHGTRSKWERMPGSQIGKLASLAGTYGGALWKMKALVSPRPLGPCILLAHPSQPQSRPLV